MIPEPEHSLAVIALMSSLAGILIYSAIYTSAKLKQALASKYGMEKGSEFSVYIIRLSGVVFLGLLPGISILALSDITLPGLGLSFINIESSLLLSLAFALIIIPLVYFTSKSESNLGMYPQVRKSEWSLKTILYSSLSWILYLAGYELLFRGVLLFPLIEEFGYWPAVSINIIIYSLSHFPKGLKEIIACVPIGLILCLVTLATGTIWTALLIHISMAVSNDLFSFYHHPEMKFAK